MLQTSGQPHDAIKLVELRLPSAAEGRGDSVAYGGSAAGLSLQVLPSKRKLQLSRVFLPDRELPPAIPAFR